MKPFNLENSSMALRGFQCTFPWKPSELPFSAVQGEAKHTIFLAVFLLLIVHIGYAQDTETDVEPSCNEQVEALLKHQADFKHYPDDVLTPIIETIASCDDGATNKELLYYTLGRLYLELDHYAGVDTGIRYLELSSATYHLETNLLLGTIYSTGLYGQYTDWYKAHLYFSRALYTDPDNAIANYAMGYIKLKNLWTIDYDNNDEVARSYFEASTHPMAQHWLAILYYYGIGGEKNPQKAIELLENNDIFNSQRLLEYLPNQPTDWIAISTQADQALRAYTSNTPSYTPNYEELTGTYEGHLVAYDWALTGVRRYIPFTLIMDIEDLTPIRKPMTYEWIIEGHSYTGTGEVASNIIRFDEDLSFTLPRLYQDHPDTPTITYRIDEFRFKEADIDGATPYIGKVENCVAEAWKEPVRNLKLLFSKTSNDTWEEEEEEEIIEELPDDFARITPNPASSRFRFYFTTAEPVDIQITIYDFYGNEYLSLPNQIIEDEDKFDIKCSDWADGTYIMHMRVNGTPYAKLLIKD